MKSFIRTVLITTLASVVLAAPPSNNTTRIVIASEVGARFDSDVIKGGETDDTLLFQSILDWAPELGSLKLIVDGAILVKGLKVHSNTTIECLNGGVEPPTPGDAVQCPIDGLSRSTTDSPCRDEQ